MTAKGPRTIEHVDRPLRAATELPGEGGMHALLLEVGQPVPDGIDESWHRVDPIDPSVPILLHQTDTNPLDVHYFWEPSRVHVPDWLFTLGPIQSDSLVQAVQARGEVNLSLVLRGTRDDGATLTAHWLQVQLVADFDSATGTWWLDWRADPVDDGDYVWIHTVTPSTEEAPLD